MPAEIANSDQDQFINADLRLSDAGLNGCDNPLDHQFNDDHTRAHQTAAAANREDEDFAVSKFQDRDVANEDSERQAQPGHKPSWRRAINWVKEKQQDRSLRMSDLRPSTSLYTKFENEATRAKSPDPYRSQEVGGDGEAQTQTYTKAAEETVHTFLRQSSSLKYPAVAQ